MPRCSRSAYPQSENPVWATPLGRSLYDEKKGTIIYLTHKAKVSIIAKQVRERGISMTQAQKIKQLSALPVFHPVPRRGHCARAPNQKLQSAIPKTLQDAGISTFADLFCGIGGFHYAAHDLGLKCIFASDIDDPCREQYKANLGIFPQSDITRIADDGVPDHDLLLAGFPCQPFSIIGDMNGVDDRRGRLFDEILRILKAKRPKAVVLENVRQFSTISRGAVLREVLEGLAGLGYSHQWKVLNALDFGLPQKRERTIIVGFQSGADDLFQWPEAKGEYTPLKEILEPRPDKRHFVSEQIKAKRKAMHRPKVTPSIWHENKGGNISSHPFSCALRANASYNYLLVNGERRLTPREMLRLQGFPESFEIIGNDSQIRKQMGNAVPVPMIRAVVREVLHAESENARRNRETRAVSA